MNHSYLCPVLGPKYNRVAESEFPTSAWQVEMWVFRDVYGEEERDLVKDGLWTGEMSMCSSQRHVSTDAHFPVYKKSHASWQWSCLLLHMPLSSINLTLPSSLVNAYLPHILIHLTPEILTTHLEHIAFHYLHSTISSCNLDLHFSLFFESCRHRGLVLTYYTLCSKFWLKLIGLKLNYYRKRT